MSLSLALSAVFPIMAYMLAGALLNARGKISEATMNEVNGLIYRFCFPLVMFNGIYTSNLESALDLRFLGLMVLLLLLMTGLALLILPRVAKSKPALGSMLQGVVRSNSLLFAFPVVIAISGPNNTGLASLCLAVLVPLSNVLCVIILETLRGERLRPMNLLTGIVRNPIMLGTLAALPFKVFGIILPGYVSKVVSDLAGIVTPVALIILGAGLRLSDTRTYRRELAAVGILKLMVMPLLYVLAVRALGFGPVAVTTAMAFGVVPTAVSTFVMARQMQADSVLAGQIVAVTTMLSVFSVFLWVLALSALGWIG